MSDQAHAAVLQFLLQRGYRETQEAFVREAGDRINFDRVEEAPSVERLVQDPLNSLSTAMADVAIERAHELKGGDGDYFSTLVDTHTATHPSSVLAVAVQADTGAIAAAAVDRTVKLTGQGGSEQVFRHHAAPVLSLDFHPLLPHLLLTSSMDGTCAIVDTAQTDPDQTDSLHSDACVIQRLTDHTKYVVRALFSSDGTYLATASYDATLCIYQAQSQSQAQDQGQGWGEDQVQGQVQDEDRPQVHYRRILRLGPFLGNVETICFAGPDTLVAGVNNDNYLHYIHLPDGHDERVNMNANNDDWVSFSPQWISCSPDGRYLLCTTNHSSGRIILFAIHQSTQVQNYYHAPSDSQFTMRRHAWHPSGLYFYASGSEDNRIAVIETKTGQVAAELSGHTAMVRTMTVDSAVGLVSGAYDQRINVWSKDVSRPIDR